VDFQKLLGNRGRSGDESEPPTRHRESFAEPVHDDCAFPHTRDFRD
jgi:hypothetical protein